MSSYRPKKKAVKNDPLLYEEKKEQRGIWVTPTAWEKLKSASVNEGISVSELVERWARTL